MLQPRVCMSQLKILHIATNAWFSQINIFFFFLNVTSVDGEVTGRGSDSWAGPGAKVLSELGGWSGGR